MSKRNSVVYICFFLPRNHRQKTVRCEVVTAENNISNSIYIGVENNFILLATVEDILKSMGS